MKIYFDLDETLIHAKYASNGNPGKRTPIKITNQDGFDQEVYYSILRPHAKKMLATCRAITKVKMLTTATKDYAVLHNKTFDLGFDTEDIIAREDYLTKVNSVYGSYHEPSQYKIDPNAILIDNLPPNADAATLKQQYLGINPENYIQIREFSGKDPEIFENEVSELLERIRTEISKETSKKKKQADQEKTRLDYSPL